MNTDPLRLLAAMALGLAWVGWTARVWWRNRAVQPDAMEERAGAAERPSACLLYTSDAADERSSGDLGGSRVIKKKKVFVSSSP